MQYIELINKFWQFSSKNNLGATAIAMYLFLLQKWNENDDVMFQISDIRISKILNIKRETVKKAREILKEKGLINFQCKKGFPMVYKILSDYSFQDEELVLPVKTKTLSPKEELPIIPKEKNKEPVLSVEVRQQEIKPPVAEEKEKAIEKPQLQTNGLKIPTVDEFLDFARKQEIYTASKELDYKIKAKYDDWKSKGWKNHFDKPITNWEVAIKNSLPYMLSTKNNDINVNDIPSIRRPKATYNE